MSWLEETAGRPCPECKVEVDPDARFCEQCGAEVPESAAPALGQWSPRVAHDPGASVTSRSLPAPLGTPEAGNATQTYLGHRLVYTDSSTDFNPLSNAAFQRTLLFQFLATVAVWFVVTAAITVLQLVAYAFSLAGDNVLSLPTEALSAPYLIGAAISTIFSIVLACVFWFRPLSVQLSEWMITIDGAGEGARAALEHMYLIVHNRQTPVRTLRVVRLQAARQQQRDYLRLDDAHFSGFVSSFAHGTDLFIGWTFWLTMSPAQWMWLSLGRMFRDSSNNIYKSLVNDRPKAMREVMHAAVRQGVDMATGRIRPIGQGALGSTVPYTSVEA